MKINEINDTLDRLADKWAAVVAPLIILYILTL